MAWYNQSRRHSLASRGIKTAQKVPKSMLNVEKTFSELDKKDIIKAMEQRIEKPTRFFLENIDDAINLAKSIKKTQSPNETNAGKVLEELESLKKSVAKTKISKLRFN